MQSEQEKVRRGGSTSVAAGGATSAHRPMEIARKAVLLILVLGLVGTLGELVLLRHWGGVRELIPFILVVLSVPILTWSLTSGSPSSRKALQATMIAFLIVGVLGSWFHFTANIGYEQESNPGLAFGAVVRLAVGGSTPTLAPGALIELGLCGLLLAFLQSHTNRG